MTDAYSPAIQDGFIFRRFHNNLCDSDERCDEPKGSIEVVVRHCHVMNVKEIKYYTKTMSVLKLY